MEFIFWPFTKASLETIKIIIEIGGSGVVLFFIRPLYKKFKRKRKEQEIIKAKLNSVLEMPEQIQSLLYSNTEIKNSLDKSINVQKDLYEWLDRLDRKIEIMNGRQKAMLNNQNAAYFTTDHTGGFDYISPAACKMINRSESEMHAQSLISWLCRESMAAVVREWDDTKKQKRIFDDTVCFRNGNEKIQVRVLAFHTFSKQNKEQYLGSYGTFELQTTKT